MRDTYCNRLLTRVSGFLGTRSRPWAPRQIHDLLSCWETCGCVRVMYVLRSYGCGRERQAVGKLRSSSYQPKARHPLARGCTMSPVVHNISLIGSVSLFSVGEAQFVLGGGGASQSIIMILLGSVSFEFQFVWNRRLKSRHDLSVTWRLFQNYSTISSNTFLKLN